MCRLVEIGLKAKSMMSIAGIGPLSPRWSAGALANPRESCQVAPLVVWELAYG